jgi:hypothetical protein
MRASIAVNSECLVFNKDQYAKFLAFIENIENNTMTFTVDSVEQLLLNNEFKTVGGNLQFTWTALRQCCDFLSKSLYKLIRELLRDNTNKAAHSDASAIFNTVLKRKFDKLRGKKILKNVTAERIEAVTVCVPSDTTRLFLNSFVVSDFIKAQVHDNRLIKAIFSVASHTTPLSSINFLIVLKPSGAIKLSALLSVRAPRGTTGRWSGLEPYVKPCFLNIVDISFNDKFAKALNKVLKESEKIASEFPQLQSNLENISLGLTGESELDKKQIYFLSKKLTRLLNEMPPLGSKKIKKSIINKVIQKTLYDSFRVPSDTPREAKTFEEARLERLNKWPSKTMLDLFYAMLFEFKNIPTGTSKAVSLLLMCPR